MQKNWQRLLVEQKDAVAFVRLNRPELHNAFDELMIAELTELFQALSQDASLRVVVLSGEGKSFCAGADLNWMKQMADYDLERNMADAQRLHEMFYAIYSCSKPVIAQVHGAALGGGVGLIAAADIAVASQETQFGLTEARLGLIPAVISPFVLQKIGAARAREYFLTAERFSAADAYRFGLLSESVEAPLLLNRVEHKIQQLKASGPDAIAASKKLLDALSGIDWGKTAALTTRAIAERRVAAEGQEGMQAFLQKRKASWLS